MSKQGCLQLDHPGPQCDRLVKRSGSAQLDLAGPSHSRGHVDIRDLPVPFSGCASDP